MHDIERALNFDPLAHAEELTGKSYKTDDDTASLGLGLHLVHGEQKRDLLRASGDTYWAQPMAEWMGVVDRLGFRLLLTENIPDSGDKYRLWWRDDGLLLKADSYYGDKSVNGSEVVFNYCGPRTAMHGCSSGHAGELGGADVWNGSRDAREGLCFAINRMESQGRFLNPWIKRGFLWLLHYQDTKREGFDYRAITEARVSLLPADVQAAIAGSPDEA